MKRTRFHLLILLFSIMLPLSAMRVGARRTWQNMKTRFSATDARIQRFSQHWGTNAGCFVGRHYGKLASIGAVGAMIESGLRKENEEIKENQIRLRILQDMKRTQSR